MSTTGEFCTAMKDLNDTVVDGQLRDAMARMDDRTPDAVVRHIASSFLKRFDTECQAAVRKLSPTLQPGQVEVICSPANFRDTLGWLAPTSLQAQLSLAEELRTTPDLESLRQRPLLWLSQKRDRFVPQTNWCDLYPGYPDSQVRQHLMLGLQ